MVRYRTRYFLKPPAWVMMTAVAGVCLFSLAARTARAAEPDDNLPAIEKLYREGMSFYKQKQYKKARMRFRQVNLREKDYGATGSFLKRIEDHLSYRSREDRQIKEQRRKAEQAAAFRARRIEQQLAKERERSKLQQLKEQQRARQIELAAQKRAEREERAKIKRAEDKRRAAEKRRQREELTAQKRALRQQRLEEKEAQKQERLREQRRRAEQARQEKQERQARAEELAEQKRARQAEQRRQQEERDRQNAEQDRQDKQERQARLEQERLERQRLKKERTEQDLEAKRKSRELKDLMARAQDAYREAVGACKARRFEFARDKISELSGTIATGKLPAAFSAKMEARLKAARRRLKAAEDKDRARQEEIKRRQERDREKALAKENQRLEKRAAEQQRREMAEARREQLRIEKQMRREESRQKKAAAGAPDDAVDPRGKQGRDIPVTAPPRPGRAVTFDQGQVTLNREFLSGVDRLYRDAMELYVIGNDDMAQQLLTEVEKLWPDYKLTRRYLNFIGERQARQRSRPRPQGRRNVIAETLDKIESQ